MAELILMERGAEQMNIHPEQLEQYLQAGWKELDRKAIPAELQSADEQVSTAELAEKKAKSRKAGKADDANPAESGENADTPQESQA